MNKSNEAGLTNNQIVSELTKSPHGALKEYLPIGQRAATEQPEFFAHLIAWNARNGQIRDSKKALPVIALTPHLDEEFRENALAHLAMLNPREFTLAYRFALELRPAGYMSALRRLVAAYVGDLEAERPEWNRAAVQHRESLAQLYALCHLSRTDATGRILFGNEHNSRRRNREKVKGILPPGSVFDAIARLKDMSAEEAAGTIMHRKIPFLVAMAALGARAKEPDIVIALLARMTPTEVITNTKAFERLGVKTVPALKAAFEAALAKAAKSGNANTLKTAQAIDAVADDAVKEKLRGVQEKQIAASKGIEGNWLVLGDASGSMAACVEIARYVAGTLSKMVRGNVMLCFFNTAPRIMDVTGMDYDAILTLTRHVQAGGGTSIGCGLLAAIEKRFDIDGIAVVSDAKENTAPFFADQYKALCGLVGKQPPVYLYRVGSVKPAYVPAVLFGDRDLSHTMQLGGFDIQEFDLNRGTVDYYALPNLVQTMRANRYSLYQEIIDTPLKKISDVLPKAVIFRKETVAA